MKILKIQQTVFILTLLLFISTIYRGVSAQTNLNCTVVGRWEHGPCYAMATGGDTLFFHDGGLLRIMDFSNKILPVELGRMQLTSPLVSLAFKKDYLYLMDENSILTILDVRNPAAIAVVDTLMYPDRGMDLIVEGDRLFVLLSQTGMYTYTLSNPEQPVLQSIFNADYYMENMAVAGDRAYIVENSAGFHIVDISNPAAPREIGSYLTNIKTFAVAARDQLVFMATSGYVRIMDVSNPAAPAEIGVYEGGSVIRDVACQGHYLYIANSSNGFKIVDISDYSNPVAVFFLYSVGNINLVAVSGTNAFYAVDFGPMIALDVTDPTNAVKIGEYAAGRSRNVLVKDNLAFIANSFSGLKILDLSNPALPVEISTIKCQRHTYNIMLISHFIYAMNGFQGISIIDVTDPAHPSQSAVIKTSSAARNGVIVGNYAYIALDENGIGVLDVSNPLAPVEISILNLPGEIQDMAGGGNYICVARRNAGLSIIDVSDPANPIEKSNVAANDFAVGVAIAGNYVYWSDLSAGLRILDISDPANPAEIAAYAPRGIQAGKVQIQGDRAWLADLNFGLVVLDVANPAQPLAVGACQTNDEISGISVVGDWGYLAEEDDGLYIVRFDKSTNRVESLQPEPMPQQFVLSQNHPNPFNPSTLIQYHLPRATPVILKIYNLQGQVIKTLVNEFQPAGIKTIHWGGVDEAGQSVASGIYFYQLITGTFSDTKKMLLVH